MLPSCLHQYDASNRWPLKEYGRPHAINCIMLHIEYTVGAPWVC